MAMCGRLPKRDGAPPPRWSRPSLSSAGGNTGTTPALFLTVSRLVAETGDEDIRRLFAVANSLHVNFYENWDTAQNVAGNLDDVERSWTVWSRCCRASFVDGNSQMRLTPAH